MCLGPFRFGNYYHQDEDRGQDAALAQPQGKSMPFLRGEAADLGAHVGCAGCVHGVCEAGEEVGDADEPADDAGEEGCAEAFDASFPPAEVEDGATRDGFLGLFAEEDVGEYGGGVAEEEGPVK